jgi:hypothetical protein
MQMPIDHRVSREQGSLYMNEISLPKELVHAIEDL